MAEPRIAAVAIGRNEGARLDACLASLTGRFDRVVYVDSGSSDGSLERAAAAGAEGIALDPELPFTAARGRNAGFERLMAEDPPDFVQFIDGDCMLDPNWISAALGAMAPDVAVVCGRRREARPEASLYNRLCDLEWATPVGEATACGGDALIRAAALHEIGLYRADVPAGEEPEMCLRLRRAGWRILRIDAEMTGHDVAMTRFSQWWRRCRRAGMASALGAHMHGRGPERHGVRRTLRALGWGAVLPFAIVLAGLAHPLAWAFALIYPAQIARLAVRGGSGKTAWLFALFNTLAKFAEAQGALGYLFDVARGRPPVIIEPKGAAS